MATTTESRIRLLRQDDLPRALELSMEAGWNQTANDWDFFSHQAHVYGLEVPEAGVVATTVAWDLSMRVSWIAMVLVAKSWRGRGFARDLMQHAVAEAEARGRAPALDATPLGEPVYARLGFGGGPEVVRLRCENPTAAAAGLPCVPLQNVDLDEVAEVDARVAGFERVAMLRDWMRRRPALAWGTRDAHGTLTGFVLGREGRTAEQIGPLISPDADVARRLLAAALGAVSFPVYIDVPVIHATVCDWLMEQGFAKERSFKRMSRPAGVIPTDWTRTFAIAGPDFG